MQVIRRVLILLCMFFFGFISSVYANHQGYDCLVCHDSVATRNLNLIREVISTPNSGPKEVWFTAYTGWRSFADGDTVYDGVCEVCHTITSYHTNYGDGTVHFDGQDCTECHPHANDFYPEFTAASPHQTHFDDPKGPQIGADACFTACHLSSSDFRIFKDNQPIETTNVCDACHSPSGSFNGVGDMNPENPNSVAYGAKYNWGNGIYEPAVPPDLWPSRLKAGKENWCAGCHDDGSSVINGVSAPNVMGDNTTYGYNISGHGRDPLLVCAYCHDLTMLHADGDARTYSASSDNYREGYRLNEDMAVPRYGEYGPIAFKLCMNCHIYSYITGSKSNFRDDNKGLQLHEKHLGQAFAHTTCWDSDWNENLNNCTQGECADSAISCTACHNVHGSPTPAMIRHGELISTPGTTDKVPALRFRWYKEDGSTQTMILGESRYGGLLCGTMYNVSINHVCWGCHPTTGELRYYRIPPPTIGYSPSSFSFTATQGGSNPPNQTLSISNTGGGTLNWTVSDNATWLSLNPTSGTNSGNVTLSVNIAGLTAGTYNGIITIAATGATNSPVNIPVILTVNPPPTIIILNPNGGEIIPSGATYTINWGAPPEAVRFDIGYSLDDGAPGTWKLIASNITSYSYNVTVPALDGNKNKCRVGVRGYNASGGVIGTDTSDNPFTIEVIKVTDPDGGETITSGTTYQIRWQTNSTIRPVQTVKIYGSPNEGQSGTWLLLTTISGNPGYYDWTVPSVGTIKDRCRIGVVLLDSMSTNIGQDGSDDNFTIQPAP